MLNSLIGIIASSGGVATAAGSYESIATTTVGLLGSASVTFSSIPSTYQHLQIRYTGISTAGANGQYAQVRVGNGSVDTGSNYAWHDLVGQGASTLVEKNASQSIVQIGPYTGPSSNSNPYVSVIDILDYGNVNKNKTIKGLTGCDNNGSGSIDLRSALWFSTSAINTITIYAYSQGSASTFGQYSSFALYGIKG
jgi:hypothetical protein